MASIGFNEIIILITLFLIFGIFYCYDLFRKGTKIGYLAYIIAVIPVNYIWILGYDVLGVYLILFILWILILLRDLIIVYRKDKDADDILLFLGLGILVQIIISAILPARQINPELQKNTVAILGYFFLPAVYDSENNVQRWVNPDILLAFRIAATLLVILVILPMIVDIVTNEEEVHVIVVVIFTAIFILPFLFLSYVWVPQSIGVLTLLFSVVLFIILFIATKRTK